MRTKHRSSFKETLQLVDDQTSETLKDFFIHHGFEVVDKRDNGGSLWVIGHQSQLEPYVTKAFTLFGVTGNYGSGKATKQKDAWWTKSEK